MVIFINIFLSNSLSFIVTSGEENKTCLSIHCIFFMGHKYRYWYSVFASTQIQVSVLYWFEKRGIVASLMVFEITNGAKARQRPVSLMPPGDEILLFKIHGKRTAS